VDFILGMLRICVWLITTDGESNEPFPVYK